MGKWHATVLAVSPPRSLGAQVASKARQMASVKIAADFLGLALADVLLAIGQSAFSGNAAAMSFGPNRAGDAAMHPDMSPDLIPPDQMQALRQSLEASYAA